MLGRKGRANGHLRFWILGVFIALAFAWVVGYFFLDGIMVYELNPVLGILSFKPGVTYTQRSEGWATSHTGKYGVIGVPDITAIPKPKVVIWGDSYVEGFQVNDPERMPQVVTRLLAAADFDMMAFGVGKSGESVADYYFQIPKYEKLSPPIVAHFMVLCNLSDVLPDQPDAGGARLVSQPILRFVPEVNGATEHQRVKSVLATVGLSFVWRTAKAAQGVKTLRFGIGPPANQAKEDDKPKAVSDDEAKSAWSFLLSELNRESGVPMVFVYCPHLPRITDGRIEYSDENGKRARMFGEQCRRHGIGFINMEKSFGDYTRRKGLFPRGFPNSRPSDGHFNKEGHRLVAEAIFDYIKGHRAGNVIHAD